MGSDNPTARRKIEATKVDESQRDAELLTGGSGSNSIGEAGAAVENYAQESAHGAYS